MINKVFKELIEEKRLAEGKYISERNTLPDGRIWHLDVYISNVSFHVSDDDSFYECDIEMCVSEDNGMDCNSIDLELLNTVVDYWYNNTSHPCVISNMVDKLELEEW